jgi:hypothetical protein
MGTVKQSAMTEHTLFELCQRNNESRLYRKPFVLALICPHVIGMEMGFSYLKNLREERIRIRISAEDEVLTMFSKAELVKLTGNDDWIPHEKLEESVTQNMDVIFIPFLSFSLVSDILSLNDQRPFVRLIIMALLKGIRVIGLKVGTDPYHQLWRIKGMDKGSNLLKRKLYESSLQLKSLGIMLIDETETNPFSIKATFRKTVITEETIKYAHQQNQSTLVITKETIITPLARDAAREWNIALILQ